MTAPFRSIHVRDLKGYLCEQKPDGRVVTFRDHEGNLGLFLFNDRETMRAVYEEQGLTPPPPCCIREIEEPAVWVKWAKDNNIDLLPDPVLHPDGGYEFAYIEVDALLVAAFQLKTDPFPGEVVH